MKNKIVNGLLIITVFGAVGFSKANPLPMPHNFEGLQVAYSDKSIGKVNAIYGYRFAVRQCTAMRAFNDGNTKQAKNASWQNCLNGLIKIAYSKQADHYAEMAHDDNQQVAGRY